MSTNISMAEQAESTVEAGGGEATSSPAPQPGIATEHGPDASGVQAELERTRRSLAALTRERQMMRELFALGAADLDVAAAELEREVAGRPDAEIPAAAARLKQRRPTLFRQAGGLESLRAPVFSAARRASATMSPRVPESGGTREEAAAVARESNSRTSLLHYMRLKRQPAD